MLRIGFDVVSRLRCDAALYYVWDGKSTCKHRRPRVKGEKTGLGNLDMSKVRPHDVNDTDGQVYALDTRPRLLEILAEYCDN